MLDPGYKARERCVCTTVLKKWAEGEEPGNPAYSCTSVSSCVAGSLDGEPDGSVQDGQGQIPKRTPRESSTLRHSPLAIRHPLIDLIALVDADLKKHSASAHQTRPHAPTLVNLTSRPVVPVHGSSRVSLVHTWLSALLVVGCASSRMLRGVSASGHLSGHGLGGSIESPSLVVVGV